MVCNRILEAGIVEEVSFEVFAALEPLSLPEPVK